MWASPGSDCLSKEGFERHWKHRLSQGLEGTDVTSGGTESGAKAVTGGKAGS